MLTVPASAESRRDSNLFNGSASCAASGCHELGLNEADPDSDISRNEYEVWRQEDQHSQSYGRLLTPQAQLIARNMGVGPAHESSTCLGCHAMNVPEAQRGPNFNIEEGVGCEGCHGGSGQWKDTHQDPDVSFAVLEQQGLFQTYDVNKRADMCLDCHFGASDQFAGHKLLAAGHPRVSFDLAFFTDLTAHHVVDADYKERKEPPPELAIWGMGQAKMIERRMDLLASPRTGTIGFFPEFAFFDCHGCHQPISQKRKSTAKRRGQPKFDDAHMQMLRIALERADAGLAGELARDTERLHRAAAQGRGALVDAAVRMRDTARRAVGAMAPANFSGDDLKDMLRTLANLGASGKYSDYAAAEQLMMAVQVTMFALLDNGHITEEEFDRLDASQTPIIASVESDERYSPGRFVSAMQQFRNAVR